MLQFINSDPDMIKVFLAWLDLLGVARGRTAPSVSASTSRPTSPRLEQFWAESRPGWTPRLFEQATLKKHNPKTDRKNAAGGYRGCS